MTSHWSNVQNEINTTGGDIFPVTMCKNNVYTKSQGALRLPWLHLSSKLTSFMTMFLQKLTDIVLVSVFLILKEPQGSSQCSKKLAIRHNTSQFNPVHTFKHYSSNIHFNIMLPFIHLGVLSGSLP